MTSEEDEGGIDVSIWCEWCAYGGFVLTLPSLKKRDLKLLDGVIIDVKKTISNALELLGTKKGNKASKPTKA
ncbi:MAG: hypothetical protein ACE5PO_06535 [Candidatus Bathyarchaeia archaeon]